MGVPESEQLDLLPIERIVTPDVPKIATIRERFEAFHEANPWVYSHLVRLTRDYLNAGHPRTAIGMLTEVLRWQYGTETGERLRINNNFRAHYARLILERHPEWDGVFETRELRAAG